MSREGYDVALICLNGHVVNDSSRNFPEANSKHCSECGVRAIAACEACNGPIRGMYWGGSIGGNYDRPSFCRHCGAAYPWTTRHLEAAQQLATTLGELTDNEREEVQEDLATVVRDLPATPAAAGRLKRVLGRLGTGAGSALRDILVDIASETAKKVLFQ